MTKLFLLFTISFWSLIMFSQTPQGRYFDEINGTTWSSSETINESSISEIKNIGLRLVEFPVDSLKQTTLIWTFGKQLKIESYDPLTKKRSAILNCKYEHLKANRTLKLHLPNKDIEFAYLAVSTGNYVGLTRKKIKR